MRYPERTIPGVGGVAPIMLLGCATRPAQRDEDSVRTTASGLLSLRPPP